MARINVPDVNKPTPYDTKEGRLKFLEETGDDFFQEIPGGAITFCMPSGRWDTWGHFEVMMEGKDGKLHFADCHSYLSALFTAEAFRKTFL